MEGGTFEVRVPAGLVSALAVAAPSGYMSLNEFALSDAQREGEQPIEVLLDPTLRADGFRLVDEVSGDPVPGYLVEVGFGGNAWHAVSDTEGWVAAGGPLEGELHLLDWKERRIPERLQLDDVRVKQIVEAARLEIACGPSYSLAIDWQGLDPLPWNQLECFLLPGPDVGGIQIDDGQEPTPLRDDESTGTWVRFDPKAGPTDDGTTRRLVVASKARDVIGIAQVPTRSGLSTGSHSVVMRADPIVRCHVRNAQGEPVQGAAVLLYPAPFDAGMDYFAGTTGSDGQVEFVGIAESLTDVTLMVNKSGYQRSPTPAVLGQGDLSVTLTELGAACTVSGRLLIADANDSVEVQVYVEPYPPLSPMVQATVDEALAEDGSRFIRFTATGLPAGMVSVHVVSDPPGYYSIQPYRYACPGDMPVAIEPQYSDVLSVRFRCSGTAQAGFELWALDHDLAVPLQMTCGDQRELGGTWTQSQVWFAAHPGVRPVRLLRSSPTREVEGVFEYDINWLGGWGRVLVLHRNGAPVPGAQVQLNASTVITADADGVALIHADSKPASVSIRASSEDDWRQVEVGGRDQLLRLELYGSD